jgi:hypothetical protein
MTTLEKEGVESTTFLMERGLPKNGAVSLVSVLWVESGLKPGSQGNQPTEHGGELNRNGAFGIASWNGPVNPADIGNPEKDRQARLNAFCKARNIPFDTLDSQLLFCLTEIANNYHGSWDAIRNVSKPISEIISELVVEYEVPKNKPAEIDRATHIASQLLQMLPATIPAPAPAPAPPAPPAPPPLPPQPTPTPPPPAPTPPAPSPDNEVSLINVLVADMKELDPNARRRVLAYIVARFGA